MKDKFKIFVSIFVISLLVFILFHFTNLQTNLSSLCHGKVHVSVQGSPGVFGSNDQKVYFLLDRHYYKPAAGICAFPDGGIPLTIQQSIDLCEIDLNNHQVRWITNFSDFSDFKPGIGSDTITISHNIDDKYYAVIAGQDSKLRLTRMFIEFDVSDGVMRKLNEQEYQKLTRDVVSFRSSFEFDANERWVEFQGQGISRKPIAYLLRQKGHEPEVLFTGLDWLPNQVSK